MRFKTILLGVMSAAMILLLASCAGKMTAEDEKNFYFVTFMDGDETVTQKRLEEGSVIRLVPRKDAGGNEVEGWMDAQGNFVEPDGMTVSTDMEFYVYRLPELQTEAHVKYMGDIASVWFRPDVKLRRSEAAQLLYALMQRPETDSDDVPAADDTQPESEDTENEQQTEPEIPLTIYQPSFSDVSQSDTYYQAVMTVASYHLMSGYADGTFRPDEPITRAEFAAMLAPFGEDAETADVSFADVPRNYWAADAIAAAAGNGWMEGYSDGCFYPENTVTRAESVVIINRMMGYQTNKTALSTAVPENLYVDVTKDHWAYYDILSATYSSELLSYIWGEGEAEEPGFVTLDGMLYHVDAITGKLDYYLQGFHTIDGTLRYCSEAGYAIDQFSEGCHEVEGSMYYALSDGSFAVDTQIGYLYFDLDGRYTSGSDELDALVEEFLSGILDDDSLSRERKLYAAYTKVMNSFGYLNRGDAYSPGMTGWAMECATVMFEKGSGHCFYWAGAFMYLARRIGYQAYPVCGYAGTYMSLHAWTMIDWSDGNEYIFDPELQWAYARGDLDGYVQYRDLYMQPFYYTGTLYTFADGGHTTQR